MGKVKDWFKKSVVPSITDGLERGWEATKEAYQDTREAVGDFIGDTANTINDLIDDGRELYEDIKDVRCSIAFYNIYLFGLSKERPILNHHPKAHIHEIRRISPEIHPKPYKVRCFNQNSSVWVVHGGGYDPGFLEIQGHSPSPPFIKLDSFG